MRFAYRKTAYRIMHNLRPTKILKEAKHRRKGNTEPSDPVHKITGILEIPLKRQRDIRLLGRLLLSSPLGVLHHVVPDARN